MKPMRDFTTITMRTNGSLFVIGAAMALAVMLALPSIGQDKKEDKAKAKAGQPSEQEMMSAMMEMAKLGDNHKLLARGVGEWTYQMKTWMNPDPSAAPSESSGVAVVKPLLGGRYFQAEHSSKFPMPGQDGKMVDFDFKGSSVEGYDNVKKKFVSTWIDNMSTGIMVSEGTYDAATKSLTYHAEFEMMPGMKTKVRQVLKIKDDDHKTFEFFEDRGGTEVKTMEIAYTRKK